MCERMGKVDVSLQKQGISVVNTDDLTFFVGKRKAAFSPLTTNLILMR